MNIAIHKNLQNEGLINTAASISGITHSPIKGSSLYYGTGLTTCRSPSVGLPFDFLGMILVAEKLYRTFELSHIYHHIADTHALTNSFNTPSDIEILANKVESIITSIVRHLKIEDHFTILRSSSFDNTKEYNNILNNIQTEKNGYVQRELTDMHWYRKKHNVTLKLGWIIQTAKCEQGFDERLFDEEYQKYFGDDMQFIYLKSGRTFDQKRPKAAPYISIAGEQRILLESSENVEEKINKAKEIWNDKTLGGALNHLSAIVRLYNQIAPESCGNELLSIRIQTIINRIFHE